MDWSEASVLRMSKAAVLTVSSSWSSRPRFEESRSSRALSWAMSSAETFEAENKIYVSKVVRSKVEGSEATKRTEVTDRARQSTSFPREIDAF